MNLQSPSSIFDIRKSFLSSRIEWKRRVRYSREYSNFTVTTSDHPDLPDCGVESSSLLAEFLPLTVLALRTDTFLKYLEIHDASLFIDALYTLYIWHRIAVHMVRDTSRSMAWHRCTYGSRYSSCWTTAALFLNSAISCTARSRLI